MEKKLKSLDQWNSEATVEHWNRTNQFNNSIHNGIECPTCKEELMDTDPNVTLTSNPPQKNVHCPKCGYKGFRISY